MPTYKRPTPDKVALAAMAGIANGIWTIVMLGGTVFSGSAWFVFATYWLFGEFVLVPASFWSVSILRRAEDTSPGNWLVRLGLSAVALSLVAPVAAIILLLASS